MVVPGGSATLDAIRTELVDGCSGLLGRPVPIAGDVDRDGAVVVGTPASSPIIAGLDWGRQLAGLGPEGFRIRSVKLGPHTVTVIASEGEVGALYGAFHFLRLLQTLRPIDALDVSQRPRLRLRVLDHWDNLDGSVERGYAGRSLWHWEAPPGTPDPRLRDYARADASVGINGSVLNNVNADSRILRADYLRKVGRRRRRLPPLRGAGLSVRVASRRPMELGGLKTADPLDPGVVAWWKTKADEIYALIPDFGGFLVKASSEGQPGPHAYHRSHVDGANMLAAALAPHGGVVMWRAFVYDPDARLRPGRGRLRLAPALDGRFAPNVLLQVKNGPIDFQPREPFHPLFGAMPKTPLMLEAADHPGVPRLREPPRLPGPDVARVPGFGHLRQGPRLDRGPRARRQPLRTRPDRHRRRGEHRLGPQLDRPSLRPGQLVRLRPPGLGPRRSPRGRSPTSGSR